MREGEPPTRECPLLLLLVGRLLMGRLLLLLLLLQEEQQLQQEVSNLASNHTRHFITAPSAPRCCSQCLRGLARPEEVASNGGRGEGRNEGAGIGRDSRGSGLDSNCVRQGSGVEEKYGGEPSAKGTHVPFPRPELWPTCGSETSCPAGCGDMYCSPRCQRAAWETHHQVLCPGAAEGRGALGRLEMYCR